MKKEKKKEQKTDGQVYKPKAKSTLPQAKSNFTDTKRPNDRFKSIAKPPALGSGGIKLILQSCQQLVL